MDLSIQADQATDRQLLLALIERQELMAEQLDRLNAAVDRELADDAAQNQLIAELRAQLATAQQVAADAVAGNAQAQADLQGALDAAAGAAARLESNDAAPTEPEPPAEPVEPVTP